MNHPILSPLAHRWSSTRPNTLNAAIHQARADGRQLHSLVDATARDPALQFPPDLIAEITQRALDRLGAYQPDPMGMLLARVAIADYYVRRSESADPDQILITPGTSLAYFYALRLLTEPGDEILVPRPGYPLFDDIAALCGLSLRYYHLTESEPGWQFDMEDIAFQVTSRTKAIAMVSPHNPTGAILSAAQTERLGEICTEHNLAFVFDEVFCESRAQPAEPFPRPSGEQFPLAITLNGFSKMFALPGWKVGWMKVAGHPEHTTPFLQALAHLNDTFLPMPDLQQSMIPDLLIAGDLGQTPSGKTIRPPRAELNESYTQRRMTGLDVLNAAAPDWLAEIVPSPEAGVYLCLKLKDGIDDEQFALKVLKRKGALVHPGYYYDLPQHIVMTCVAPCPELERMIGLLCDVQV